jgi:glucuronosyltransferase
VTEGAHILLYPFGHCLNSHLLNAERLSEILAAGGHDVDMIVSTAYKNYEHHSRSGREGAVGGVRTSEEMKILEKGNGAAENAENNFEKMKRDKADSEEFMGISSSNWKELYCDKENSTGCQLLVEQSLEESHSSSSADQELNHRYSECIGCRDEPRSSGKGSIRLLEFPSPKNYTPVCELDTLDFMLTAPLAERFSALIDTSVRYCDSLLSSALLRRLKATPYSVIVLESVDPCSRILADYLDRPFVLLVTTGLGHFDTNPRPPSYLPAAIAPYTTSMNFAQRVVNLLLKLMYDTAIPVLWGFNEHFEQLKRTHNLNLSLSLDHSFLRASLKLVNSDFSIEYPAPIEPDTVLIGGFSVPKPTPLASDLQTFMDGADEHGVIVFSFGTLVKRFSQDWTTMFLEVLSRLPQRVVWRYHGNITNSSLLGSNIKLMKWLPQASLLAHRNTKLFVSHCGLNALFEAAHFGVPVLAIPLSGDQLNNAAKISDHLHMGVRVDIHRTTVESLYADFIRVLTDKTFATNAREVADLLRDQPMTSAEKILFWVDFVARHHGASHLHSIAATMPLYQYLSLDVIFVLFALLLVLITAILLCSYKLLRFALCLSVFISKLLFRKIL